jgi:hypothetical protein
MPPKLNPKRALFVLTKIDEILAWEARKEAERETRFVEPLRRVKGLLSGNDLRRLPGWRKSR